MIRTLFGGWLLATLPTLPARAEGDELMQLGALGVVAHFRSEAADRAFFAEGSAELGSASCRPRCAGGLAARALFYRRHRRGPRRRLGERPRQPRNIAKARRGQRRADVQRSEPAQHHRAASP
jgi:hypothetical protein